MGKAFLKLKNLLSRCKQSPLKASDFRIQFMILKVAERNGFLLLKMDENLPLGNSRSNSRTLKDTFLSRGRGGLRLQIFLG